MKRIYTTIAILVSLVLLGGCVSKEVMLGAGDNARQIELNKGQTLVITLEANPTTGYTWEAAEFDEHILRQVGEAKFQPQSSAIGAGGVQIMRFETINAGKTLLKLVYHRPWEKNVEPLKNFSILVVVR